jgi:hypothetical protein
MEKTITTLLASIAGGRRYWVRAPVAAQLPFVVLQRVTGMPNYNMQGASGYVFSRIQIDVYATSYSSAKTTAAAVKTVLSGYSDSSIQAIFIDSERDLPAADVGEVTDLFRTSIDITIHHGE